jgi:hypothetical protein
MNSLYICSRRNHCCSKCALRSFVFSIMLCLISRSFLLVVERMTRFKISSIERCWGESPKILFTMFFFPLSSVMEFSLYFPVYFRELAMMNYDVKKPLIELILCFALHVWNKWKLMKMFHSRLDINPPITITFPPNETWLCMTSRRTKSIKRIPSFDHNECFCFSLITSSAGSVHQLRHVRDKNVAFRLFLRFFPFLWYFVGFLSK